jgi:phosphohistidine phosphatase
VDLFLIRHAEALPLGQGSATDADRPLSSRGQTQARGLGQYFKTSAIHLERILSSPLLRARQTAEEMRSEMGSEAPPLAVSEALAPGGKRRKLARFLREFGATPLAVVGHQPDLGLFAGWLIGSKKAQIELAKGGLAKITCPEGLRKAGGALIWLLKFAECKAPESQA